MLHQVLKTQLDTFKFANNLGKGFTTQNKNAQIPNIATILYVSAIIKCDQNLGKVTKFTIRVCSLMYAFLCL